MRRLHMRWVGFVAMLLLVLSSVTQAFAVWEPISFGSAPNCSLSHWTVTGDVVTEQVNEDGQPTCGAKLRSVVPIGAWLSTRPMISEISTAIPLNESTTINTIGFWVQATSSRADTAYLAQEISLWVNGVLIYSKGRNSNGWFYFEYSGLSAYSNSTLLVKIKTRVDSGYKESPTKATLLIVPASDVWFPNPEGNPQIGW